MLIASSVLDIRKIKLIIWDMDNTFWEGVISEGQVSCPKNNIELIKELSRRGIVNSICSKNDFEPCERKLRELGVWEYFVFPSIDWTPKSNRVHSIISDMNLRPANVLFLDDEPANLERALLKDDSLMCGTADSLVDELRKQLKELPVDPKCGRLRQYQELQNKVTAKKNFDSDEEFLRIAEIKVSFGYDCDAEIERIYELINRTNQLNYTKKRMNMDEVEGLLKNENFKCGYIHCTDRFCDYGIVGFFAVNVANNAVEHFLFSCRTIGMGVEQFVYARLGFPQIAIVGDVVTPLNQAECPDWIELATELKDSDDATADSNRKILIKGPCDVSQILPFFADGAIFESEFAYVSSEKEGMYVESFNHTAEILFSLESADSLRKELIETIPFIDKDYFDTKLFSEEYDYVIFSLLTDYSLGLYQHKENPALVVAFGQYTVDYTKEDNWNRVANAWVQDRPSQKMIQEQYDYFRNNYRPVGRISNEAFLQNLEKIRQLLPTQTKLILLNGAELPYEGNCKASHIDRHLVHQEMNAIAERFVSEHSDSCYIVDVNDCLQSQSPYLDTINHYKKTVYYRIAKAIQEYISSCDDAFDIKTNRVFKLYVRTKLRKLKESLKRLFS